MALAILKANGYRLLEAGNAEQALGLSATYSGKIDLLLTDVIMPGLNGRQLADRLVVERPGLKVLYTSGYTADVITLQGSLEPGMEYLPKPFGAAQPPKTTCGSAQCTAGYVGGAGANRAAAAWARRCAGLTDRRQLRSARSAVTSSTARRGASPSCLNRSTPKTCCVQ